jgi:kynurenine formamidase
MIIELIINNEKKKADLTRPIDLSLTSKVKNSFKAWYVDEIQIKVIKNGGFVGSVNQGGSVNFKELLINPHGNMTHTESVGHISNEEVFVNNVLSQNHFSAQLITISPQKANSDMESGIKAGDFFIGIEQIKDKITPNIQSLILRTQSTYNQLNDKNYNNTNWPYLSQETATYIRDFGIVHLLIDQPSVDKEFDGGKLLAHKAFWNYPNELDKKRTITELIGIPDEIIDGIYLLNLFMANIENDASPSRPTIYELF